MRQMNFKPSSKALPATLLLTALMAVTAAAGTNQASAAPRTKSVTMLFVADADNHRVLGFSAPLATGMQASLVIGQPGFMSTAPGIGSRGLHLPADVALDQGGNLYVADYHNGRVLVFRAPLTTGMAAAIVI